MITGTSMITGTEDGSACLASCVPRHDHADSLDDDF